MTRDIQLRPGDVLITYGTFGLWPPRRWLLWIAYKGIRAYQRAKWGDDSDYSPTHVRLFRGDVFFEMTIPRGRLTDVDAALKGKKKFKVVRWMGAPLDANTILRETDAMIGQPYDKGDLLDMGISGLLGRFWSSFRIFGDRENKYRVCSTAIAKVLREAGASFSGRDRDIDPAYFANTPNDWEVVYAKGF